MISRDHTLAIALLVSLAIHAGFLLVLAGGSDRGHDVALAVSRAVPPARAYILSDPPPAPAPAQLLFGDLRGIGNASNSAPGDKPLSARQADEIQALLSRDPQGPGTVGQRPAPSVLPRGGGQQANAKPPPAPAIASPVGVPDTPENWSAPRAHRTIPLQPAPPAPVANRGKNASPGAPDPPADPAIQSESESDPFTSSDANVEFSDGRVQVRLGRKVRTVRPELSLAAKYDLLSIGFPKMLVRLRIDPAGSVRKVDVIRSSGSQSADQAVKVALYQWWIEPKKDKSGRAIDNVIEFPIVWH